MNIDDLAFKRQAAEDILRRAGNIARDRFLKRDFKTEMKGLQDYVSQVDSETEHYIRNALKETFPNDGFLGEETGGALSASTWIVDPIDGTSNFTRGIGQWCLSAALVINNRPVIGIIYDPNLDEMFSCHESAGTTLNGKRVYVADAKPANKAILGISFNFQRGSKQIASALTSILEGETSFRMLGSGALSLAYSACGRTDGFWEPFMKPWDAAAGLCLAREAGALICDYGNDNGFVDGNAVLTATPSLASYFSQHVGIAMQSQNIDQGL